MAEDREQKIRDVYEAMVTAYLAQYPGSPAPREGGSTHTSYMRHARAAVDVLDPVKRIELSGGFHAEPVNGVTCKLYLNGVYQGPLNINIIEAWEKAGLAAAERHKLASDHNARAMKLENAQEDVEILRKANDELKGRIATLGNIVDALGGVPARLDTDHHRV